jgi:predicted RNA-binding protein
MFTSQAKGDGMCLSTAYIEKDHEKLAVMKDIVRIERQNNGFLLVGLLGEEKHVQGKIRCIDFIDRHSIIFENDRPEFT